MYYIDSRFTQTDLKPVKMTAAVSYATLNLKVTRERFKRIFAVTARSSRFAQIWGHIKLTMHCGFACELQRAKRNRAGAAGKSAASFVAFLHYQSKMQEENFELLPSEQLKLLDFRSSIRVICFKQKRNFSHKQEMLCIILDF